MTIADVESDLRVRSADVRVILRTFVTTCVSYARTFTKKGKCPMEPFYNMIRQWYVSTNNTGMLPEQAEKMLS